MLEEHPLDTFCLSTCSDDYTLDPENEGKCILDDCDFGYSKDKNNVCVVNKIACPDGSVIDETGEMCIPEAKSGIIIPFPFVIIGVILLILVIIGQIKACKTQKFVSSLLGLVSLLEFPYLIVQLIAAAYITSWGIFIGTLVSFLVLVGCNITMYIVYWRRI